MKNYTEKCPIWGTPACIDRGSGWQYFVDSPLAGGSFSYDSGLRSSFSYDFKVDVRVKFCRWLSQVDRNIEYIEIDNAKLSQLSALPDREVTERFADALNWFAKNQKTLSDEVEMVSIQHGVGLGDLRSFAFQNFLAASSCIDDTEGFKVLEFLQKQEFLSLRPGTSKWQVTPRGWEQISLNRRVDDASTTAFVAMWFSKSMDDIYADGFASAVADAGYEPIRIDRKEHNNKIDDEIVAEIRRSKFVIADFTSEVVDRQSIEGKPFKDTHARGGVYFEAGFAKGLGKEVIWTVREDVLPFVHFDTRQFAHIVWKDAADLRMQLSRRISATLGDGPNKK